MLQTEVIIALLVQGAPLPPQKKIKPIANYQ